MATQTMPGLDRQTQTSPVNLRKHKTDIELRINSLANSYENLNIRSQPENKQTYLTEKQQYKHETDKPHQRNMEKPKIETDHQIDELTAMIHSKTTLETSPHLIISKNNSKHQDPNTYHIDLYHKQMADNLTIQKNQKSTIGSKTSFKTLPIEELNN